MTEVSRARNPRDILLGAKIVGGSLVAGGVVLISEYLTVSSIGFRHVWTVQFIAMMLAGLVMLAMPVIVSWCLVTRRRRTALVAFVSCLLGMGILVTSMRLKERVRMSAFAKLAERSAELVEAIKAYERIHGEPPASLSALVPKFIAAIPKTGIGAYPTYRYHVGKTQRWDGNPWVLSVFASKGVLNFDEFLCYPLQNYPATRCGNRLERVGDWAYLHE